jgi:hypothetical protein
MDAKHLTIRPLLEAHLPRCVVAASSQIDPKQTRYRSAAPLKRRIVGHARRQCFHVARLGRIECEMVTHDSTRAPRASDGHAWN